MSSSHTKAVLGRRLASGSGSSCSTRGWSAAPCWRLVMNPRQQHHRRTCGSSSANPCPEPVSCVRCVRVASTALTCEPGIEQSAHVRLPTHRVASVLRSSTALVERTRLALPALNWPHVMRTWAIWANAPGKAVHAIFPDHVQLPPMNVQILRASPSVRPKSQKTQSAQGVQSGLQPQFPCCGHQDGTAV